MRPDFSIHAGSEDVTQAIKDRLLELSVTDEAGIKSDKLKLVLDDRRLSNGSVAALPGMGTKLSVALGYAESGLRSMGCYMVDEVELRHSPATLAVSASAADMSSPFRCRKTRSWDASTLGAMVESIALEHGFIPRIDPELGRVVIPHLDQVSESDMALLTRLAEKHDAIAKPVQGYLVLARAGEAKSVSGEDMPWFNLDISEISSWTFRHRARSPGGKSSGERGAEKQGGFKAHWWDCEAGKDRWVTVGEEPFEELAYRHKTAAEARAAASAKLNKGQRQEGSLSLSMPSNPKLAAECPLTINLRPGLARTWRIIKVEHRLNSSGFTTQVEAEFFLTKQEKTI